MTVNTRTLQRWSGKANRFLPLSTVFTVSGRQRGVCLPFFPALRLFLFLPCATMQARIFDRRRLFLCCLLISPMPHRFSRCRMKRRCARVSSARRAGCKTAAERALISSAGSRSRATMTEASTPASSPRRRRFRAIPRRSSSSASAAAISAHAASSNASAPRTIT